MKTADQIREAIENIKTASNPFPTSDITDLEFTAFKYGYLAGLNWALRDHTSGMKGSSTERRKKVSALLSVLRMEDKEGEVR